MDRPKSINLVEQAKGVGRTLFEEQLTKGYGAIELQERLFSESQNSLREYRKEIWQGYTQRSIEQGLDASI